MLQYKLSDLNIPLTKQTQATKLTKIDENKNVKF